MNKLDNKMDEWLDRYDRDETTNKKIPLVYQITSPFIAKNYQNLDGI